MKKPWQSKSLWVALIVAVAAFIPGVDVFVKANLEMVGLMLGGIFGILRLISNGKISIE